MTTDCQAAQRRNGDRRSQYTSPKTGRVQGSVIGQAAFIACGKHQVEGEEFSALSVFENQVELFMVLEGVVEPLLPCKSRQISDKSMRRY